MDTTVEPTTPLSTISPERMNRQPLQEAPGNTGCPARGFGDVGLTSPASHSCASDVQNIVARFEGNMSPSPTKDVAPAKRAREADASFRRALIGREEAEGDAKRMREEIRALKEKLEDANGREGMMGRRIEGMMEEKAGLQQSYEKTQSIFEKEVRRARKEAFKASSQLVRIQEELKTARNRGTLMREEAEEQKRRVEAREKESFAAQYRLVEVEAELGHVQQHVQAAKEESEALRGQLAEQEVARMALTQQVGAVEEDRERVRANLRREQNAQTTLHEQLQTLENEREVLRASVAEQDNARRSLRKRVKAVEEERDALKNSLKAEEVARIAAEGKVALPTQLDHDEFASPKKATRPQSRAGGREPVRSNTSTTINERPKSRADLSTHSRNNSAYLDRSKSSMGFHSRNDSTPNNRPKSRASHEIGSSVLDRTKRKADERHDLNRSITGSSTGRSAAGHESGEVAKLREELLIERRAKRKAEDLVEFMHIECQLQRCSCRLAEEKGSAFVHDPDFDSVVARATKRAKGKSAAHHESGHVDQHHHGHHPQTSRHEPSKSEKHRAEPLRSKTPDRPEARRLLSKDMPRRPKREPTREQREPKTQPAAEEPSSVARKQAEEDLLRSWREAKEEPKRTKPQKTLEQVPSKEVSETVHAVVGASVPEPAEIGESMFRQANTTPAEPAARDVVHGVVARVENQHELPSSRPSTAESRFTPMADKDERVLNLKDNNYATEDLDKLIEFSPITGTFRYSPGKRAVSATQPILIKAEQTRMKDKPRYTTFGGPASPSPLPDFAPLQPVQPISPSDIPDLVATSTGLTAVAVELEEDMAVHMAHSLVVEDDMEDPAETPLPAEIAAPLSPAATVVVVRANNSAPSTPTPRSPSLVPLNEAFTLQRPQTTAPHRMLTDTITMTVPLAGLDDEEEDDKPRDGRVLRADTTVRHDDNDSLTADLNSRFPYSPGATQTREEALQSIQRWRRGRARSVALMGTPKRVFGLGAGASAIGGKREVSAPATPGMGTKTYGLGTF